MLCIRLYNNDPYFCLAAEEYLMKNFDQDIFMLWQSDDTVVIGKHQNAMGEINYPFVIKNRIKVARRISGGGTVFHDAGNLNFAYIKNVESPSEISFSRFVKPIVEALGKLDIKAVVSGRNDLLIDNKKISGNAEHIFKNRVLHHGTLLFDSDLTNLGKSIKVVEGKYQSKAVQSKRSTVTNILPYLKDQMSISTFANFIFNSETSKPGSDLYDLTADDIAAISQLATEKFMTWEWNYGYSPKYQLKSENIINGKQLQTELQVEKGVIQRAELRGNYFSDKQVAMLQDALIGERHSYADIRQHLLKILHEGKDELVFAFF